MSSHKEQNVSDEDIPSDFFDDFNKDEFMDGLSVIDSWDDEIKNKRRVSRINAEAINSVDDVRELISDRKDNASRPLVMKDSEDPWESSREPSEHKTEEYKSSSHLDDYIKPGSRRDPNKTNKAIKKDKEVKVKEYLAKHLDSSEDLKPPGTELDDFFDESKLSDKLEKSEHRTPGAYRVKRQQNWDHLNERSPRASPVKHHWSEYKNENSRRSPHWSPRQNTHQYSPYQRPRREEFHYTQQYHYRSSHHHSPHYRSPHRRSPHRRSPPRRSPPLRSPHRRSPLRRSPHHRSSRRSPLRHRSRSPKRSSYSSRKSRSRSPQVRDSFLYPKESQLNYTAPQQFFDTIAPQYTGPMPSSQGYAYGQNMAYTGGYSDVYHYEAQPMPSGLNMTPASYAPPMPVPQPVPAPGLEPPVVIPTPIPAMVPAPQQKPPVQTVSASKTHETVSATTPYDALAQLVADGKLSQEDYLKLAPNKGKKTRSNSPMDTKTRVAVLNRCNTALSKLGNLVLPNRLIINNHIIGQEQKKIMPKYCSPLKRYGNVDFHFSKPSESSVQHNKQILDGIIAAIGLENVVVKPSRKPQKNMKDAAVQTTRPYCDICEIRDATKFYDAGTSIDQEYFQSTVHTQVVEQDLFSSKAVFNPTGSIGDGAPISIAHMTPAQLVSQLAARAKTFKQNPDSSDGVYGRRNAQNNYDYNQKGGGGHQYQNNYNYRY